MAFEAVLSADGRRPLAWKRGTVALSLLLHALLLIIGVVYSFWRVDELPLPSVVVTLMAGLPPPPPPPPPPAGGGKKHTIKPKTKPVEVQKTELVQPKEQPKETPPPPKEEKEDDDNGVEGGVKGGVVGGVVGGEIGPRPMGPSSCTRNFRRTPRSPSILEKRSPLATSRSATGPTVARRGRFP